MKASAAKRPRESYRGGDWLTGAAAARRAILYVTPGYRLIALDAKTGIPVNSFGENGVVDLKQGVQFGAGQQIDLVKGEIGLQATPVVAKDEVIVGAAFQGRLRPNDSQQHERIGAGLRRAHRQADLDISHDSQARENLATTRGSTARGLRTETPACGRRSRWMKIWASPICRSKCPPAITMAATAPATDSSATRSWPSI